MRQLGLTALRITEPGIYARNLYSIAPEYGLGIIHNFWVPDTIDFRRDTPTLQRIETDILDAVAAHGDQPALLNWNFGNDPLSGLAEYHLRPELQKQREAYMRWLNKVIGRIRAIDSSHPIMLNVTAGSDTRALIENYRLMGKEGQALGLSVPRDVSPERIEELLVSYADRLHIGDIHPAQLTQLPAHLLPSYLVLNNWQNEWQQGLVTFDGLYDFQGLRTVRHQAVREYWGGPAKDYPVPPVSYVVPGIMPLVGEPYSYYATVYREGNWSMVDAERTTNGLSFAWSLVRNDALGNAVDMTEVGTGPVLELKMPSDHLAYELLLTVADGAYSRSVKKPLLPR